MTITSRSQSLQSHPNQPEPPQTQMCRICHETDRPLIRPCLCKGSLKFVHRTCIQKWLQHREPGAPIKCEICQAKFVYSYTSRSPLFFLLSAGSWRRWVHVAYIIYVLKRYTHTSSPSVDTQETDCPLLYHALTVSLLFCSHRILAQLRFVCRLVKTRHLGGRRIRLISKVIISSLVAAHCSLLVFLDARHLVQEFRRWRVASSEVIIFDRRRSAPARLCGISSP